MSELVLHKHYSGCDIRSSPCAIGKHFKRRIDVTYPDGIKEYIDNYIDEALHANSLYKTIEECHAANFEWGRQLIDKWKSTGER